MRRRCKRASLANATAQNAAGSANAGKTAKLYSATPNSTVASSASST
jgi:hypothetical protein